MPSAAHVSAFMSIYLPCIGYAGTGVRVRSKNGREPLGKRLPPVGLWSGDQSRTDSDSQSSTSPVAASILNSYSVPL